VTLPVKLSLLPLTPFEGSLGIRPANLPLLHIRIFISLKFSWLFRFSGPAEHLQVSAFPLRYDSQCIFEIFPPFMFSNKGSLRVTLLSFQQKEAFLASQCFVHTDAFHPRMYYLNGNLIGMFSIACICEWHIQLYCCLIVLTCQYVVGYCTYVCHIW